jgi:hypothetical protein
MQAPRDPPDIPNGSIRGVTSTPLAERFVTGDKRGRDGTVLEKDFARGFAKGILPHGTNEVRVEHAVSSDVTDYRLGEACVSVSGLEMIQADSIEALGYAKGQHLRRQAFLAAQVHAEGEKMKRIMEDCLFTQEYPPAEERGVPVPVVSGWSGGGSPEGAYGVLTVDIEGEHVRYVPESTRKASGISDFDHWYASEYTRVLEKHIRKLQDSINTADGMLSQVLHEMAGEASLCWDPKPAGVFDSSKAIVAVERAIEQLRSILRGV